MRAACLSARNLPANVFVSVNVSPRLILHGDDLRTVDQRLGVVHPGLRPREPEVLRTPDGRAVVLLEAPELERPGADRGDVRDREPADVPVMAGSRVADEPKAERIDGAPADAPLSSGLLSRASATSCSSFSALPCAYVNRRSALPAM